MSDIDLAELLARAEITDVVARLARGTDRRDKELVVSCYHDDGVDDHNVFRGPAAEFAEWVTGANSSEWEASSHVLAPPVIEVRDDRAVAETGCIAHHVSTPHEDGSRHDYVIAVRYIDQFERREGVGWRIRLRTVIYDWVYRVPLAEEEKATRRMPFPDGFRVGRPDASDPSYAIFESLAGS